MIYLFSICFSTLSNYANDNDLLARASDIQLINQMSQSDFGTVNNWFYEKYMVLNLGKCHFLSIGKGIHDEDVLFYDILTLKNSIEEDMLRVTIDRKLTSHQHIKKVCHKVGPALIVLLSLSPYIDINRRKTTYTTMVKSQFNYCPLFRIICNRKSNKKSKKERFL